MHIELTPPEEGASKAHASVSVNSLGLIDNLQIAATGLDAGQMYKLFLVGALSRQELTAFQAGIGGTAIAQTFGPLKRVVAGSQAETMTLEVRSADATADLFFSNRR